MPQWAPPAATTAAAAAIAAAAGLALCGGGAAARARRILPGGGALAAALAPLLGEEVAAAAAAAERCFYGPIIHSLSLSELQVMPQGLLGVDAAGRVCFVLDLGAASTEDTAAALGALRGAAGGPELVELGSRMLMPGFVDAHAHAPQHAFTGTALDLPLLEWLERYTFPHEARFADVAHARKIYSRAVRNHLKHGTTTVSYFATIHNEACKVLVEVCREQGQRAYVGKVNMDRNSPESYCEETVASLRDTRGFVDHVLGLGDPLITPVITPRFVPSCTPALMRGLAAIADEHQLPLQSHLSENLAECDWVRSLHPDCENYSDVYDKHGLYTSRSYMAHCVHCARPERDLVLRKGVGIVHCPNSNFTLASGVCNVREWLEEGHKVGLGTDVAGGYSPSILNAIRMARVASVATTAPIVSGELYPTTHRSAEQSRAAQHAANTVRA
jgi:guanine deaminase